MTETFTLAAVASTARCGPSRACAFQLRVQAQTGKQRAGARLYGWAPRCLAFCVFFACLVGEFLRLLVLPCVVFALCGVAWYECVQLR